MKFNIKRVTKWVVFNSIFFTMLYFALWEKIPGAINVVEFFIWFLFVVSLLTMVPGVPKEMMKDPEKLPSKPWRVFDGVIDICVTLAFIWFGWWVIGSIYAIHVLLLQSLWSRCDDYLFKALAGDYGNDK